MAFLTRQERTDQHARHQYADEIRAAALYDRLAPKVEDLLSQLEDYLPQLRGDGHPAERKGIAETMEDIAEIIMGRRYTVAEYARLQPTPDELTARLVEEVCASS